MNKGREGRGEAHGEGLCVRMCMSVWEDVAAGEGGTRCEPSQFVKFVHDGAAGGWDARGKHKGEARDVLARARFHGHKAHAQVYTQACTCALAHAYTLAHAQALA